MSICVTHRYISEWWSRWPVDLLLTQTFYCLFPARFNWLLVVIVPFILQANHAIHTRTYKSDTQSTSNSVVGTNHIYIIIRDTPDAGNKGVLGCVLYIIITRHFCASVLYIAIMFVKWIRAVVISYSTIYHIQKPYIIQQCDRRHGIQSIEIL